MNLYEGLEIYTEEIKALVRLMGVAKGFTTEAKQVATFLLSWGHPAFAGGFVFSDIWSVDKSIEKDMVTIFGLALRLRVPPARLGYGSDFEEIARSWPELAKCQTKERV